MSDDEGVTPEVRAALIRHGYNPDALPRGISGGPEIDFETTLADGRTVRLRNRVCYLDGIRIDRHEGSDLDPGGGCIHCGKEWDEIHALDGDW